MSNLEDRPTVSVLMLAFNHGKFIAEAIEGVLEQECTFPIELIVAEDCSTDDTLEIAKHYQRLHPTVIRIVSGDANVGMMRNFHRGLSQCRGEFVAFCEGDDWWINPRKLEMQVEIMRRDPDIGMVHGNFRNSVVVGGKWIVQDIAVHDGKDSNDLSGEMFGVLLNNLKVRTCTVICRKSILNEFQRSKLGNPAYVAGDLPMALYISSRSRVGYVADVVSVYRISPNSATRSSFPSRVRFLQGITNIYDDVESLFGSRSDYDPGASLWVHVALSRAAFRANDRLAFGRAVSRIVELQPDRRLDSDIRLRGLLLELWPLAKIANRVIDGFQHLKRTAHSVYHSIAGYVSRA
jgi:glycosyltransferase involved in cell wall biosynthesis